MTDGLGAYPTPPPGAAGRPMQGMTVLAVEDSRFAAEALRLLCLRSGARLRRADCLTSARRHLCVYRPTAVIVDMGLPDGSGRELIAELAASVPRLPVILATSGDPAAAQDGMRAGADGILAKPVDSLAAFQTAILSRLAVDGTGRQAMNLSQAEDRIRPDRLALRDDLAHAAGALEPDGSLTDPGGAIYLSRFLTGLAKSSDDTALADAAARLARNGDSGPVARILHERLAAAPGF